MPSKPVTRTARSENTRENTSRQVQWQPASKLPTPDPRDGIEYRWIRNAVMGEADPSNFSRSLAEHWEPCSPKDVPEIRGINAKDGIIEIGGLVLCMRDDSIGRSRTEYYKKMTKNQMSAVNNNFMRENDERMPLFSEHHSEVKFGSGS